MHQKLFQCVMAIVFLLAACAPAIASTPTVSPPQASITTPHAAPTKTQREPRHEPTHTPIPPTPLPTIPRFTQTFDVSSIVTVTPGARAECPIEDSQKAFVFDATVYDPSFFRKIQDFLNAGGSRRAVVDAYQRVYTWADNSVIQEKDVTGDNVEELLFTESGFFYVFLCDEGQYETKLLLAETYHFTQPIIVGLQDLNRNAVVEIIAMEGDERVTVVSVFEWDGNNFRVLNPNFNTMYGPSGIEILDTNDDGVIELILKQGIPIWSEYYEGLPWRLETRTFVWDGQQFALHQIELASPEFRFQAIQDADAAMQKSNFNRALHLYQEAINNDQLRSFSAEILRNLRANIESQQGPTPASSPTPYPADDTEYPKLAAYAYYRIMLLHFSQENVKEANLAYKALQEGFGSDQYAQDYAEMATEFWIVYQSTHEMYDGCAAAIQFAVEHPEILIPLGSDYHGWQSHTYAPADVCPFR